MAEVGMFDEPITEWGAPSTPERHEALLRSKRVWREYRFRCRWEVPSYYWAPHPHQVYRCFREDGTLLYVGATSNALRRVAEHASKPWLSEVARIELKHFPCRAKALIEESRAIDAECPLYNTNRGVQMR